MVHAQDMELAVVEPWPGLELLVVLHVPVRLGSMGLLHELELLVVRHVHVRLLSMGLLQLAPVPTKVGAV